MNIPGTAKGYYDIYNIPYYRDLNRNDYITLIGWLNLAELQERILIKDKMNVERFLTEALKSKTVTSEDLSCGYPREILTKLKAEWVEDSLEEEV